MFHKVLFKYIWMLVLSKQTSSAQLMYSLEVMVVIYPMFANGLLTFEVPLTLWELPL